MTVLSFGLCQVLFAAGDAAPVIPAAAALAKLQDSNARFVFAANSAPKPTGARRAETAKSQHPFAMIVGSSDSRTSPEIIFDQNLGDLFVVRTAGYYDLDSGKMEWLKQ